MSRFAIAPMDTVFKLFTYGLLLLPVGLVVLSAVSGPAAPAIWGTVALIVGVYAGVWFGCRPGSFSVDSDGIHISFPLWTRHIPVSALEKVERYPGRRYRDEVGWGLRVGAGGLWGVFGWLITPIGWLEVYSSRIDDLVLVWFGDRIPLLISPDDLDGFASAVEALLPAEDSAAG